MALALLTLAEGFGSGEGALAASGVLGLAFVVVGWLVTSKLKAIDRQAEKIASLETAAAVTKENEKQCALLEKRVTTLETELAIAKASRLGERMERVEQDMREIRSILQRILDALEHPSGRYEGLKRPHNRRREDKKDWEEPPEEGLAAPGRKEP